MKVKIDSGTGKTNANKENKLKDPSEEALFFTLTLIKSQSEECDDGGSAGSAASSQLNSFTSKSCTRLTSDCRVVLPSVIYYISYRCYHPLTLANGF